MHLEPHAIRRSVTQNAQARTNSVSVWEDQRVRGSKAREHPWEDNSSGSKRARIIVTPTEDSTTQGLFLPINAGFTRIEPGFFHSWTDHNAATPLVHPDQLLDPLLPAEGHFMLREFGNDHLASMKERETKHRPNPSYMDTQRQLKGIQRCILLEWMMQLSMCMGMRRQSLHMSITLVDRVLSSCPDWGIRSAQALGLVALLIAAKVEETHAPLASDLCRETNGAVTTQEACRMENAVLGILNWTALNAPTPYQFVNLGFHRVRMAAQDKPALASSPVPPEVALLGSPQLLVGQSKSVLEVLADNDLMLRLFYRIMEVIDLARLDLGSLHFLPGVLAAAAMVMVFPSSAWRIICEALEYTLPEVLCCLKFLDSIEARALPYDPEQWESHPHLARIHRRVPEWDRRSMQRHNTAAMDHLKKVEAQRTRRASRSRTAVVTPTKQDSRSPPPSGRSPQDDLCNIARAVARRPGGVAMVSPSPPSRTQNGEVLDANTRESDIDTCLALLATDEQF